MLLAVLHTVKGVYLHQSFVEVLELCDFIVNLLTQATGKVAEDERFSISLLIVVINIWHVEVLLGNDDSILVVVAEILQHSMMQHDQTIKECGCLQCLPAGKVADLHTTRCVGPDTSVFGMFKTIRHTQQTAVGQRQQCCKQV